jgi:hypothetical protein
MAVEEVELGVVISVHSYGTKWEKERTKPGRTIEMFLMFTSATRRVTGITQAMVNTLAEGEYQFRFSAERVGLLTKPQHPQPNL